jgi:periplasmic divalent cation tolerance protein
MPGALRARTGVTGHVLVYVTAAGEAEAELIAREVVTRRLAACANIVPGMRSLYWWRNKLESARETVLLLKTTDALAEPLVAAVKQLHSYETPCVVILPLSGGNPDFLRWIEAETRPL